MGKPRSGQGRDLGISGNGAGKGDVDRTSDVKAYRRNFDGINWHHRKLNHVRSVAARAFSGGTACSSDH
jgi:hypothetical protein